MREPKRVIACKSRGPGGIGQGPEERLEAVELLRQIHYGYDPTTERLQKVITVVKRGEH